MLCIYCKEREANAREHYLPQCLGRFQNFEPLLERVCKPCNNEIGGELEREFCRRSPEAIVRSVNWIKGQKRGSQKNRRPARIYQPEKVGGRHLYLFAPDPERGYDVLWQTDERPGTIKEISQLLILDVNGEPERHIPIPTDITTREELIELFRSHSITGTISNALVIASSGDEDRVQRLFAAIGVDVPLQRRKGGKIPGPQRFTGEVGPAYFRTLAKIGFHYALRYIPTIIGSEGAFRAVREFIRYGTGEAGQFLSPCDTAENGNGPPGHILTAIAPPDGPVIVNMQFFAGCKTELPQWRLVLGPNPTALIVDQVSAHRFAYSQEDDGRLKGADIVTLSAAG